MAACNDKSSVEANDDSYVYMRHCIQRQRLGQYGKTVMFDYRTASFVDEYAEKVFQWLHTPRLFEDGSPMPLHEIFIWFGTSEQNVHLLFDKLATIPNTVNFLCSVELSLTRNAAEDIASLLRHNKTLKYLFVKIRAKDTELFDIIISALAENTTLERLQFHEDGPEDVRAVKRTCFEVFKQQPVRPEGFFLSLATSRLYNVYKEWLDMQ